MKVKHYNNYFVATRTNVSTLIAQIKSEMENEKESIEFEENADNKRNMASNVAEMEKAIALLTSAYNTLNNVHPNQYNQINQ